MMLSPGVTSVVTGYSGGNFSLSDGLLKTHNQEPLLDRLLSES